MSGNDVAILIIKIVFAVGEGIILGLGLWGWYRTRELQSELDDIKYVLGMYMAGELDVVLKGDTLIIKEKEAKKKAPKKKSIKKVNKSNVKGVY